jgi:hypothetical protein
MKLLMLEHYRDAERYFAQGEEVDASTQLAQWLIENGKAKEIEQPKPQEVKDEIPQSNVADRRKR